MVLGDLKLTLIVVFSIVTYPFIWLFVWLGRENLKDNKLLLTWLTGFRGIFVNALIAIYIASTLTHALNSLTQPQSNSTPVAEAAPDPCAGAPTSLRSVLSPTDFETAWEYPRRFDEYIKYKSSITSKMCQVCLCRSGFDDKEFAICDNITFTPQRESNAVKQCVY